jgi:hypothetical protein
VLAPLGSVANAQPGGTAACVEGRRAITADRHTETAFESVIEAHPLTHGYVPVPAADFDRERAVFPDLVLAFIRDTQLKEWAKLEALHKERTGELVLTDLCNRMGTNGSLAAQRHGFKCYGRTLRVTWFEAAHGLNPELEARYAANRLGITRQVHFSPRSEQSVDVTLTLNGIPVVSSELKNPLTGQTVIEAVGLDHNSAQARVRHSVMELELELGEVGRIFELSYPWECKLTEGRRRCRKILPRQTLDEMQGGRHPAVPGRRAAVGGEAPLAPGAGGTAWDRRRFVGRRAAATAGSHGAG